MAVELDRRCRRVFVGLILRDRAGGRGIVFGQAWCFIAYMPKWCPYVADFFLIAASVFWLLDFTPLDNWSKYQDVKSAERKLASEHVLVGDSKGNTIDDDHGVPIDPDPASAKVLVEFIRKNAPNAASVNWGNVCCIMYYSLNLPAASGGGPAFRTMQVGTIDNGKMANQFIPIASQNEFLNWLAKYHQRNIELFVGALLLVGYLIQTLARFLKWQ